MKALGHMFYYFSLQQANVIVYMPLDKSVQLKNFFFYFSTKTYVVGTQKNRLNETVLLSTPRKMLKLMDNKIFTILR